MVKPTLMQQLLKQPSQSYTNNPVSIFDEPAPSQSKKKASSSSRPSSIRSASIRSGLSSHYSDAMTDTSYQGQPAQRPTSNGWEWAHFGARKGLTGGPGSIRAPSVIGVSPSTRHLDEEDDTRSLKSYRSLRSVRSNGSINSFASGYQSIPAYGNGQAWTHGLPSSSSSSSKIKGTSRRYSSTGPATGYAQPDYTPSSSRRWTSMDAVTSSPAMSRSGSIMSDAVSDTGDKPKKTKKKKKSSSKVAPPAVVADESNDRSPTPPLSSNVSSVASSPPQTPTASLVQAPIFVTTDAAPVEKAKSVKRKKKVLAQVILEGDENGWHVTGLESVAEGEEPPENIVSDHVPSWMPRKSATSPEATAPTGQRGAPRTVDQIVQQAQPVVPAVCIPGTDPKDAVKGTVDMPLPAPSQQAVGTPAVGRKYTMDEFFSNLPLGLQGPVSASAVIDSKDEPKTETLAANDESRAASSASSFEGSDRSVPSSKETEITRVESPVEAAPIAPKSVPISSPPRIKLTRTESDQAALGISGDQDITGADDSRPIVTSKPVFVEGSQDQIVVEEGVRAGTTVERTPTTKTKRSTSPRPTSPVPVYQVIATSQPKSEQGTTAPAASKATPKWQKGVRALSLDTSAQPLILEAPRRSKSMRTGLAVSEGSSIRSSTSSPALRRSFELPATREKPNEAGSTQLKTSQASDVGSLRSRKTPESNRPSIEVPRAPSSASAAAVRSTGTPSLGMYGLTAHNLQMAGLDTRAPRGRVTRSLFSEPQARLRGFGSKYGGNGSVRGSTRAPSVSGMSLMSSPTANHIRGARAGSVAPSAATSRSPTTVSLANIRAARSTMSALSISAAAAGFATRSSSKGFSLFRKSKSSALAASQNDSNVIMRFDAGRDLTFGTLQPTPTKMRSDEVLVQVHTVGVDQFDWAKVKAFARDPSGFGFIPGRSFYGKAVECGNDVRRIKKGDMVYGLNELRRSGALAEYVIVNRDLLSVAPAVSDSLTSEQLAVLPHAGTWAVQVMTALCSELERGSKVLVLNAHDGVGNLCMRLARHMRPSHDDLWLVAQVPREVRDGEAYCVESGANDVFVDDVLSTFNCIHESSFDVVIDTVGGRRIYDASRRILHYTGAFVTTVGDSFDPDAQSHWKTSIRSLRRSFFKKDKKSISYWCVNLDAREYPRESLDKLREMVEQDTNVRPTVSSVLAFENSRNAFGDGMGSSTVVRVTGVSTIAEEAGEEAPPSVSADDNNDDTVIEA